jgi:hypothetical protein
MTKTLADNAKELRMIVESLKGRGPRLLFQDNEILVSFLLLGAFNSLTIFWRQLFWYRDKRSKTIKAKTI